MCSSCLHAKHVVNNIQLVQKIFDQATQLQMYPQKVFERQKKLNKSHFTLFLQKQIIMVKMIDEVRLIDQADNSEEPRRKESFRKQKLGTFQPNRLNGLEVALPQCSKQIFSFLKC